MPPVSPRVEHPVGRAVTLGGGITRPLDAIAAAPEDNYLHFPNLITIHGHHGPPE